MTQPPELEQFAQGFSTMFVQQSLTTLALLQALRLQPGIDAAQLDADFRAALIQAGLDEAWIASLLP